MGEARAAPDQPMGVVAGFPPLAEDSDVDSEPELCGAVPLQSRKRRAKRGRRLPVTAKRPRTPFVGQPGCSVICAEPVDGINVERVAGLVKSQCARQRNGLSPNGVTSSEMEGVVLSASIASPTSDAPQTTASGTTGDNGSPNSGAQKQTGVSKILPPASAIAATSQSMEAQNGVANDTGQSEEQRSRAETGDSAAKSAVETVWQRLATKSRIIDSAPRADSRFVSGRRPLDEEADLQPSIAVTLFPDGYARHDSAPGRPCAKSRAADAQANGSGSSSPKASASHDEVSSLTMKEIAALPRYPYDRSSADFLQALDLGILPVEKDLPEASRRHFYDGCLVAVVHDARKVLSLPADSLANPSPTVPSAPSPSMQDKERSLKANGGAPPTPLPASATNGSSSIAASGLNSPGLVRFPLIPKAETLPLIYQHDVFTLRVLLRPDGYSKLEDIEKVTERVVRDEARAVEEAILRLTSGRVDCRPVDPMRNAVQSVNAKHAPRPMSAEVARRTHAEHAPSLSTATLMLVSAAEKQLQYNRARHMNRSTASRSVAASTAAAQAAKGDAVSGKGSVDKAKSNMPPTLDAAAVESAKSLADAAAQALQIGYFEEDSTSLPRCGMPPGQIRTLPDQPPAAASSSGLKAPPERIRHTRLIQKGGQHATMLQVQLAHAAGSLNTETARLQAQKALSQASNVGRPVYVLEVMKRLDRGYQVLIFRGLPGEKRELLRFSLSSAEESNAFIDQFKIVTMAEGYMCQQDVPNPLQQTASTGQQQQAAQQRSVDQQAALANRQHQAVLQAAQYQQQISQNQLSQQQLNQQQQLVQQQQLAQAQQQFAQHQFAQQQLAAQQRRRQQLQQQQQQQLQQQQQQQHQHQLQQHLQQQQHQQQSSAQHSGQDQHQTQTQAQVQQQHRQNLQNQQKAAGGQAQAVRQQLAPQQMNQQHLLVQRQQQQMQRQASQAQLRQHQQQQLAQRVPQHQQQFVTQLQQQLSPQQSAASPHGGAGPRPNGTVNPPPFVGIANGVMANPLGLSPGMQPAQQIQNHANRAVPAAQDVMSFSTPYAYNQKPPTISQQQHSIMLQQQITMAAQNKGNQARRVQPDAATPAGTGAFTDADLQTNNEVAHPSNNRKL
jgi:hypothetical protein